MSCIEKREELHEFLENFRQKLQQQKSISNYTASAALQNALIENKDYKHQYFSFNAYLMFCYQIIHPTKEFSDLFSKSDEALSQCQMEKNHCKDEKEVVIQKLIPSNDVSTSFAVDENDLKAIQEIKKERIELSAKIKKVLNSFDGKCKTADKGALLLAEQIATLDEMNKEVTQHVTRLKPAADLLSKLDKILNSKLMQVFEKSQTDSDKLKNQCVASSREALSGVKIIASELDYDILEVFYVNTFFKKSSVEVKISYHLGNSNSDCSRGAIKHVNIGNCPVFVDDLIAQSVASNDFATALTVLQHRLSES